MTIVRNSSPFHSNSVFEDPKDPPVVIDKDFKFRLVVSNWDSELKDYEQVFLKPNYMACLIKTKKGSDQNAKLATQLSYPNDPTNKDSIAGYQRFWFRDEDVEQFVKIIVGAASYDGEKEYETSTIQSSIKHLLGVIFPNQIEVQQKYFDRFKNSYELRPALADLPNQFDLLFQILLESIKVGAVSLANLLEFIPKLIADLIRDTFKIKDAQHNLWRFKNLDGSLNEEFIPLFPVKHINDLSQSFFQVLEDANDGITSIINTIETKIDEENLFLIGVVSTIKKIFRGIESFFTFLKGVFDKFIDLLAHLNAFLVGVYNGIIEAIASIFDAISFLTGLFQEKNRTALKNSIENFYEKYKKEGIWSLISEIIDTFIQKYKNASNSYDIAKFLGEDIIQIVIEILLTYATGGGAAIKKLTKILNDLKNGIVRGVRENITELITRLQANALLSSNLTYTLISPIGILAEQFFTLARRTAWKKLNNLGVIMLKSEEGLLTFIYAGKVITDELSVKQAQEFLKNLFLKAKDESDEFIEKYLDELAEITNFRKLRKVALAKYLDKFDSTFFNHLSGDVELINVKFGSVWMQSEEWLYRGLQGQGGHWINEFLEIDAIVPPPLVNKVADLPNDVPFKAKVTVKSAKGESFPKREVSSMFPKNWSKQRIQEEIAFVYENTVVKGINKKVKLPSDIFDKFEGTTTSGFEIRIEVNDTGNIMNAYPII